MQIVSRRNPGVSIKRISVPKPQDVLAEQLRESILRGEIAEGQTLPTERDLVVQTGLSRGAVRDALKALSVEGLVETRPGRFGGSVVTLPGNESMTTAISRFVQGRRLPLRTLQETRSMLEPMLARLAAEHRTESDLVKLRELHAALVASIDDFKEFAALNVAWHNAVAQASGNPLLAALMYAIANGVNVATTVQEYDTPETRVAVVGIHTKIMEAIEAAKPDEAQRRMLRHLEATHALPLNLGAAFPVPLAQDKPEPKPSPVRRRPRR